MWGLLLLCLTLTLYLLPLLPALHEWRAKRDAGPLGILQSHEGDVSHFAQSFRAFVKHEMKALSSHGETIEPAESYCIIAEADIFRPTAQESLSHTTRRIVITDNPLKVPAHFTFAREIYSRQTIWGRESNLFRAVLAEGDLFIGSNSVLLRWAHARKVHVAPGCRILGRLSAKEQILLSLGCTFTRLHAPRVEFIPEGCLLPDEEVTAPEPVTEPGSTFKPPNSSADDTGRWVVHGNLEFPHGILWLGDLVVHGNVIIHQGAEIRGNVKSHGNLQVKPQVSITGSLISNKGIVIDRGCSVGGPVVADLQVDINADTVIGSVKQPTTVTAPVIRVASKVLVHGTVSAREQGVVLGSL
jgi:cytoskeletal protein CcmA (bactofilin family)